MKEVLHSIFSFICRSSSFRLTQFSVVELISLTFTSFGRLSFCNVTACSQSFQQKKRLSSEDELCDIDIKVPMQKSSQVEWSSGNGQRGHAHENTFQVSADEKQMLRSNDKCSTMACSKWCQRITPWLLNVVYFNNMFSQSFPFFDTPNVPEMIHLGWCNFVVNANETRFV